MYKRQAMQYALVGGECLLKPVPADGGFDFTAIRRDCYVPLAREICIRDSAQTADDAVLLDRDYAAALAGSRQDDLLVNGLDGRHVDDADIQDVYKRQLSIRQALVTMRQACRRPPKATICRMDLWCTGMYMTQMR